MYIRYKFFLLENNIVVSFFSFFDFFDIFCGIFLHREINKK